VLIRVETNEPGFQLLGRVVVDTYVRGVADNSRGAIALPVDMVPKKDYVLIIGSPGRQLGEYRIRVQRESTVPPAQAATTTSVVRSVDAPPSAELVAVPNVYGVEHTQAEQQLIAAGFLVRTFSVCSSSVGQGIVRQVLYEEGNPALIVVDKPGAPAAGRAPRGAGLVVKIGTGASC
jgi:hypothetical protein